MWRLSESDLNWVRILILYRPEFVKLLMTKSMMRYLPPKGTAGLARSSVSGQSRRPSPPARIIVSTFFMRAILAQSTARMNAPRGLGPEDLEPIVEDSRFCFLQGLISDG